MRMNGSIHRLADMIGRADCQASIGGRFYYRAVPMPFRGGIICRLRGAIEVLRGKAFAVDWPELGDLEKALRHGEPQP